MRRWAYIIQGSIYTQNINPEWLPHTTTTLNSIPNCPSFEITISNSDQVLSKVCRSSRSQTRPIQFQMWPFCIECFPVIHNSTMCYWWICQKKFFKRYQCLMTCSYRTYCNSLGRKPHKLSAGSFHTPYKAIWYLSLMFSNYNWPQF